MFSLLREHQRRPPPPSSFPHLLHPPPFLPSSKDLSTSSEAYPSPMASSPTPATTSAFLLLQVVCLQLRSIVLNLGFTLSLKFFDWFFSKSNLWISGCSTTKHSIPSCSRAYPCWFAINRCYPASTRPQVDLTRGCLPNTRRCVGRFTPLLTTPTASSHCLWSPMVLLLFPTPIARNAIKSNIGQPDRVIGN